MSSSKTGAAVRVRLPDVSHSGRSRSGFPWHYGHFMHDFLLPMSHYYDGHPVNIVKLDTIKQTIGTFIVHFADLFDVTCTEVAPDAYERRSHPEIVLHCHNYGPYPPRYCVPLKQWAYERYHQQPALETVLLIRRGVAKLAFDLKPGTPSEEKRIYKTGAERRQLKNQDAIARSLQVAFPDVFREVVLDDMPLRSQIELFATCRCLVGIHGAGMVNSVWMPRGGLVVELGHRAHPSIERLAEASECHYTHVPEGKDGVDITTLAGKITDLLGVKER